MDKKTQRCPYCQEAIYTNAIVCRYCRRDLPPNIPDSFQPRDPSWIPMLIGAALVIGLGSIIRASYHSPEQPDDESREDY